VKSVTAPSQREDDEVFGESRQRFEELLNWLEGGGAAELTLNRPGIRGGSIPWK